MGARHHRGRAEVARRHGRGAHMRHTVQRLIQRINHSSVVEHIQCATGALNGFFAPQNIAPSRFHQHQIIEAHDFHGTRCGAYVAGMAGLYQDKAGMHEV